MISVLMPVYNGSKFLNYSIKSILNQTYRNFEFVIVNDGSTDDSEKIIKSFKDERIKYFKLEHLGISKTLNFGLSKSTYDLVARMDADDISVTTRFEEQLNFLSHNPQYDVVSSWYAMFRNKRIEYVIKTVEMDPEIKKRLMLHSEIVHPGVIYRKEIIEKHNGYKTDGVEDYELWLNIKNEARFYNIQKVLTYLRVTENSSSRSDINEIRRKQYFVQSPYYKNLREKFELTNEIEEFEFRGWREYFYGNKSNAIKFWLKNKTKTILKIKILIAVLTIFLPNGFFNKIRGSSIRLKLNYTINLFSNENRNLRVSFKKLITSLEEAASIHQ